MAPRIVQERELIISGDKTDPFLKSADMQAFLATEKESISVGKIKRCKSEIAFSLSRALHRGLVCRRQSLCLIAARKSPFSLEAATHCRNWRSNFQAACPSRWT